MGRGPGLRQQVFSRAWPRLGRGCAGEAVRDEGCCRCSDQAAARGHVPGHCRQHTPAAFSPARAVRASLRSARRRLSSSAAWGSSSPSRAPGLPCLGPSPVRQGPRGPCALREGLSGWGLPLGLGLGHPEAQPRPLVRRADDDGGPAADRRAPEGPCGGLPIRPGPPGFLSSRLGAPRPCRLRRAPSSGTSACSAARGPGISRRVRHQEAPAAVRASRCAAAAQGRVCRPARGAPGGQGVDAHAQCPGLLGSVPPGGRWASAGAFVARTL